MRKKLILFCLTFFLISWSVQAKLVKKNHINFLLEIEDLIKDETHYFLETLKPEHFAIKYPKIYQLDSLSLSQENDISITLRKSVSIVNHPVEFFSEKNILQTKTLSLITGSQNVKKIKSDTFLITLQEIKNFSYQLQLFFDSDEISTLPNSKTISAVAMVKKLDVISRGASMIMFSERTRFPKYIKGAISVTSFIPIRENKTLAITYDLIAMENNTKIPRELRSRLISNSVLFIKSH